MNLYDKTKEAMGMNAFEFGLLIGVIVTSYFYGREKTRVRKYMVDSLEKANLKVRIVK